jgi:hypothetical protein
MMNTSMRRPLLAAGLLLALLAALAATSAGAPTFSATSSQSDTTSESVGGARKLLQRNPYTSRTQAAPGLLHPGRGLHSSTILPNLSRFCH